MKEDEEYGRKKEIGNKNGRDRKGEKTKKGRGKEE